MNKLLQSGTLGGFLKAARVRCKLSIKDMIEGGEWSKTTLYYYERDAGFPRPRVLARLLEEYGIVDEMERLHAWELLGADSCDT